MNGESIKIVKLLVYVQENGIIRLDSTGRFLGRLSEDEEVTFDNLSKQASNDIIVDADKLEHLLNCMCNQKFIGEQKAKIQVEWQIVIDKAYHEARELLNAWARARRDK